MLNQISRGLFVDNDFAQGRGPELIVDDPSTGQVLTTVRTASPDDVDVVLDASHTACAAAGSSTPLERAALLNAIAGTIRTRAAELVQLVACDGGLPLSLAARDVEAAARYFEFYAAAAQVVRSSSIPLGQGILDVVERLPHGTCLVLLPFNFPMQVAARDCAPALAAGNTVVLKAPEQAPLAALALAAICRDAGAPAGLVSAVTGGADIGERLVLDPRVDHVTFTGSRAAGANVMKAAATRVAPVTMELGGKSPHVVFPDADLDAVCTSVVGGTMRTAGQACSAGTRILVHEQAHADLLARLVPAVNAVEIGPALDDPGIGPVISRKQRDAVLAGVARGLDEGAQLRSGRATPAREPGWFVAPTVLDEVAPGSHVEQHELFGPVVAVSTFRTEDEALERANGTDYGLVGGVWTHDLDRALRVARSINAGQVYVNTYGVGSGVELPFGGVKGSGFGRVKGLEALDEFTTTKNIQIAIRENT